MFPNLMSSSADGVFAIDATQTVIFWNRACESLTGIPASSAIGQPCNEVLQGRDLMGRAMCQCNCPLSALTHGGLPPPQLPMRIARTGGQIVQLNVGTMLVPSRQGGEWNVVHVMRRGRPVETPGMFDFIEDRHTTLQPPMTHDRGNCCQLTQREREILKLLAQGNSVSAMSSLLNISMTTVRNHLQRMMAKLDVHTRVEAVAYAHQHHLL